MSDRDLGRLVHQTLSGVLGNAVASQQTIKTIPKATDANALMGIKIRRSRENRRLHQVISL